MTRPELRWLAVASILTFLRLAPVGAAVVTVDCTPINPVIAAALPDTTIVIHPCVYPENLIVDGKMDLRLVVAENPSLVGTQPTGVGSSPTGPMAMIDGGGAGPCLTITNSNRISVTGLAMTNCADSGITVTDTDWLVLHSNDLFATGGKGIEIESASGAVVTSNWIRQTLGHGIHLTNVNTGLVADNTVDGASEGGTGILIDIGTERTKIVRNEVVHSARSGIRDQAIQTTIGRNTARSNCLETGPFTCFCNEILLASGSLNTNAVCNDVMGGFDAVCASGWAAADNS